MSKKGVKIYSLDSISKKLMTETDPDKRKQLKLLLEEMAEVYPDENEIPNDPEELFILPKQWKSSEIKKKIVMCIKGHSSSGKTFSSLSASHLTTEHIKNDFKRLPEGDFNYFFSELKKYIPFTPIWVIGTEASTYECLTSDDNEEYFENADIRYIEVSKLNKDGGTSLLDKVSIYKNFLKALYALSNEKRGTIVVDSASPILDAQHEIVRRVVMKVPNLKEHQGIPTRHWFWRNNEQEGIMMFARLTPINFIFTIKVVTQSTESEKELEKIKWHEETNRHLSSIIVNNEYVSNGKFRSTIEKCRPNSRLMGRSYQNLTMPLFMYNLIQEKKKMKKEKRGMKNEN